MTDSVKREAFSDVLARAMRDLVRSALLYPSCDGWSRLVKHAVVFRSTYNALNVVLRLRKWNVLDELVAVQALPVFHPPHDTHVAGVVGRKREGDAPVELLDQIREKGHPDLHVDLRVGQLF